MSRVGLEYFMREIKKRLRFTCGLGLQFFNGAAQVRSEPSECASISLFLLLDQARKRGPKSDLSAKIDGNFWQWILTSILFLFKLISTSSSAPLDWTACSEINSVSVRSAREA